MGSGPDDSDSDALERYSVAGGDRLVHDTIAGPLYLDADTDVATIAYQFASHYAHPALVIDAANFPEIGQVLNLAYAPLKPLADILDDLAAKVTGGAVWWVDASGVLHFTTSAAAGI